MNVSQNDSLFVTCSALIFYVSVEEIKVTLFWGLMSSGLLRSAAKLLIPSVLKKHTTYIFKACVPLKCRGHKHATQHKNLKTWILVANSVETSNLTCSSLHFFQILLLNFIDCVLHCCDKEWSSWQIIFLMLSIPLCYMEL